MTQQQNITSLMHGAHNLLGTIGPMALDCGMVREFRATSGAMDALYEVLRMDRPNVSAGTVPPSESEQAAWDEKNCGERFQQE